MFDLKDILIALLIILIVAPFAWKAYRQATEKDEWMKMGKKWRRTEGVQHERNQHNLWDVYFD
jgi:hypothetical protein